MTKKSEKHKETSNRIENINLNREDIKKRCQQRIQLLKKRKAKQIQNAHHNKKNT